MPLLHSISKQKTCSMQIAQTLFTRLQNNSVCANQLCCQLIPCELNALLSFSDCLSITALRSNTLYREISHYLP